MRYCDFITRKEVLPPLRVVPNNTLPRDKITVTHGLLWLIALILGYDEKKLAVSVYTK